MEFSVIGESFETSISWEKVERVCTNVTELLKRSAIKYDIKYPIIATSRLFIFLKH